MEVAFTVLGEPTGKGRPKFSTFNGHAVAYTPEKTKSYENLVKLSFQQQVRNTPFDKKDTLKVTINAFFKIPKSASKKNTVLMQNGFIRPIKKPDLDNIAKAICDALNGIAYYDDSQIVSLIVRKYYAEEPRAEVYIEQVGSLPGV